MRMKKREMVETTYRYKGETYVRIDDKAEALARAESITMAGAVILKMKLFMV